MRIKMKMKQIFEKEKTLFLSKEAISKCIWDTSMIFEFQLRIEK